MATLYMRIAENLSEQVSQGTLRPGDRVPSLRQVSRQQRVSISTALQAYLWLESRGYLEARPQSGFYVRTPFAASIPEPQLETAKVHPTSLEARNIWDQIIESARDPVSIPFGPSTVSGDLFPHRRLNLLLQRIVREDPHHSSYYDFPPGREEFRRQIARRSLAMGCRLSARDVVVTGGTLEAINLGLRAVAKPGDVIAVETPTYFGILGSAVSLGMKVIEIPTHPHEGMDLNELEGAIRKHRVKACVAMTNSHNPLGYVLSDAYKRALVELTARHEVAVIEDDLYGDLNHQGPRPRTAKSFDRHGLVMLCASFSKTLSPGYRIGWIVPGRFRTKIERLKMMSTVAAPSLPQLVLASFLESGAYDRHLKRLRATLVSQVENVRQAIARCFPDGTRISRPAGGYVLWLQLPNKVSAMKLYHAALAEHISIMPGPIFSATGRYRNCIRINCGHCWSEAHDRALITLGRLCHQAR